MNTTVSDLATTLTNFKEAKAHYRQKVLEGNRELQHIYAAKPPIQNVFRQLFPELVKSRGITTIQHLDHDIGVFQRWAEDNNEVTIQFADQSEVCQHDDEQDKVLNKHLDALFIGGPSTMTACLLYQLGYPEHRVQHVFADRFDSNYDGSAYYYHQRDAAPVYINSVNRGPYCIYIDLYKRLISPAKLVEQAETNRHHVKISLSWANIKPRYLFTIFIPNFWHMVTDIWIKNKTKSKMAHVIQHACRTVPIVKEISSCTGMPIETMLIRGKNKANYVGMVGSTKEPKSHFTWLNKFAPIPFYEISREGFGAEVNQVLNFPNDGLISPMIIENLQNQMMVRAKLTQPEHDDMVSRKSFQLKKLLVRPMSPECSERMRVIAVDWLDTNSGVTHRTTADRFFISLGPSGQFRIVPPKLTWLQHAADVLYRTTNRPQCITQGYTATLASLWRHSLNAISNRFFRGSQCLKDFLLASGSSSVMLLGIDKSQTSSAQLDVFSRFVDGVNQHWTLIAMRDVSLPMTADPLSPIKDYRFFAIQMTGGGNFPSRLVRPDYLLNLLHTTEKMYGIDIMKHAIYDVIQSRGCGRAVSAQNTIAFQNLADNAVVSYALGGIGMTTMFPNGEKMLQMIEQRDPMLNKNTEKVVSMDHLLDGIDYSFMTDETQRVARSLGFDNSMSKKEKKAVAGSVFIMALVCIMKNLL
ncbi:unnamed protein product [Adineta steineri]|uniref:Uncharacterized protein n=1 Tax=Adineta steineri TaxID=433720 RepID=A0A814GER6_9BILA|nr:unnamed protein product [Adineta steineri]CAF1113903.1 unnamed protein product [Adineta steineri]